MFISSGQPGGVVFINTEQPLMICACSAVFTDSAEHAQIVSSLLNKTTGTSCDEVC